MKELIINKLMENIEKNSTYNDTKLKEIKYGLETLYITITKTIVIFTVDYLIGLFKELCLILLFYGTLRLTGFGLHAKKSIHCWIISLIVFAIIPVAVKYLIIQKNLLIAISVICFIFICKYAPADTEKRPLINKKKRTIYKIITIIITIIYIVIIIHINNLYLSKAITFSIILQTLVILPISYKMLGLPYNNYLSYKKKGG